MVFHYGVASGTHCLRQRVLHWWRRNISSPHARPTGLHSGPSLAVQNVTHSFWTTAWQPEVELMSPVNAGMQTWGPILSATVQSFGSSLNRYSCAVTSLYTGHQPCDAHTAVYSVRRHLDQDIAMSMHVMTHFTCCWIASLTAHGEPIFCVLSGPDNGVRHNPQSARQVSMSPCKASTCFVWHTTRHVRLL